MTTRHARPAVATMFRLQFEPAQESWVLLYPEGMVRLREDGLIKAARGVTTIEEVLRTVV